MKATTARRRRQIHWQIGLFFTPAILFFSLSGAVQTVGWHETRDGSGQPSTWIAWMASIHKNQGIPGKPHGPPQARPGPPGNDHHGDLHGPDERAEGPSYVPMKVFVICLAGALIFSSLTGAVIAINSPAMRRNAFLSLALGILVPGVVLLV